MKNPEIKFSHIYKKFRALQPEGSVWDSEAYSHEARLIEVLNVKLEDLSPDFLDEDTAHVDGHYALPKKGQYLLLMFSAANGILTTLRRQTPQKEAYYRKMIGTRFRVVLAPGK